MHLSCRFTILKRIWKFTADMFRQIDVWGSDKLVTLKADAEGLPDTFLFLYDIY